MSSTTKPTTPSVPSTPPSSACCSVMGNNSAAAASSALLFILNEELKNNNLLLCDQTSNLVQCNAALTQAQVRDAQRSANEAANATRSLAKQQMISGAFSIGSAVVGAGVYAHGTLPTNEESGITRLQRQQNAPSTPSSVTATANNPTRATNEQQATIDKWKNGDFTDAHKLTDAQMQEHIQLMPAADRATFATQLQTPVSQLSTMANARMQETQMKSQILEDGIGGISSLSQSQEKLNNELVDTQNSKMDEIQSDLLKNAQQQNQQILSLITSTAQADVQTGQQALQALDKIIR